MNNSRLATLFDHALRLATPRRPRCLYDRTSSLDRGLRSRRAVTTSSRKHARLIDSHQVDPQGEALSAQDQLDAEEYGQFQAAPELDMEKFLPNSLRSKKKKQVEEVEPGWETEELDISGATQKDEEQIKLEKEVLRSLRVVPASPSYFTARPTFTDDYIYIMTLLRRHMLLPQAEPGDLQTVSWRDYDSYSSAVGEKVKQKKYNAMIQAVRRMNSIHPQIMPDEVRACVSHWMAEFQKSANRPKPIEIDEFGRASAVGRRKSSSARAWVVEGDGQVMVNGKNLVQAFARPHDRESVIWALKVSNRLGRYNIFAKSNGGGTTGQAEALTLAIAKALVAHEPVLKTILRQGKWHQATLMHLSTLELTVHSWLHSPRPSSRRKEEAGSCQSAQDANLGQAVIAALCDTSLHPDGVGRAFSRRRPKSGSRQFYEEFAAFTPTCAFEPML